MTLLCCYRGFCCHTQPPSSLRQGWWGQPHHQGGGGEERGVRDTDSKYTERGIERERDRQKRWVLPPLTHTHASLGNSGRTGRASVAHPLQETNPTLSAEWIIKHLARFYIIQRNQSLRHCGGTRAAGSKGGSGAKTEGSFSTRDSDHGSNGGGGVSARWVQIAFQHLHTSKNVAPLTEQPCSETVICLFVACWFRKYTG